jgi:hypothetical protein
MKRTTFSAPRRVGDAKLIAAWLGFDLLAGIARLRVHHAGSVKRFGSAPRLSSLAALERTAFKLLRRAGWVVRRPKNTRRGTVY